MREILRHRLFVPVVLALVAVSGLGALALSRSGEGPSLTDARLDEARTQTVTDLDDEGRTQTVTDLDDQAGSSGVDGGDAGDGRVRTATVTDVDDGSPDPAGDAPTATTLSGVLVVDDVSLCVWLVNVADENPAKLFLVAWPIGTELAWDTFEATIPTDSGVVELDTTESFAFDGWVLDSIGDLFEAETERLLGLERCGHDGIVVMEDDTDVQVG